MVIFIVIVIYEIVFNVSVSMKKTINYKLRIAFLYTGSDTI
ncbi:hypothetical protein SJAV_08720 [Sulfurisphaera javensis]|uniref:Uncharacterized protein n=1 Tax=Sulfurisphaera javensis TaxID=2049879 RepID=A0AAT9GPU5_9CREN